MAAPSLVFAAPGNPWGSASPPWAPNSATNWVAATANVGVDPPLTQNWGPTYTMLTPSQSGTSFSSVPYVSSGSLNNQPNGPFNRGAYVASNPATIASPSSYMGSNSWTTANVAAYYPTGVQPAGSASMNISTLSYVAASTVVTNSGYTPYTDPYSVTPNKLNLYGQGTNTYYAPGAQAAIIAGSYVPTTDGKPLTMSWRSRSPNEMATNSSTSQNLPVTAAYLASDVMNLSGQRVGADFVLEMSFSPDLENPADQFYDIQSNKGLYLGMLVNQNGVTTWANAVSENVANTASQTTFDPLWNKYSTQYVNLPATGAYAWHPTDTKPGDAGVAGDQWVNSTKASNQPFLGSFQQFLNSTYLQGGQVHYFYEHSLDELRGTWGIDTSTDTAWAVLDVGNGIFAVVPEPATIRLVAAFLMTAGIGVWWRRRSRIKAAKAAAKNAPQSAHVAIRYRAAA